MYSSGNNLGCPVVTLTAGWLYYQGSDTAVALSAFAAPSAEWGDSDHHPPGHLPSVGGGN